ncbi:MAG: ammonium transporter [Verrucomicrobiales bacterium]|nr:ammonium transporter [Verrucomicrobiales bacterium]
MTIMKKLLIILGLAATVASMSVLAADPEPVAAAADAVVATVTATTEAVADAATAAPAVSSYEEFTATPAFPKFVVDNLWVLISAALVFIMHAGFATVETGLTQSKNTVNILFKNVFIVCMGVLAYAAWGFNSMYPGDNWTISGIFALGGPIPGSFDPATADGVANLTNAYNPAYTYWTDFIFQAMFAATAATIVSGAVAERIKLGSFMVGATVLVLVGYPITGSWEWGGGWLNSGLDKMFGAEFIDFAGSSLVHAFGGYAALAAVLLLGPRKGKFVGGKVRPILGHSMPLATIGVFLLFLGWFGFNGGSVLSADPAGVSLVFVTTTVAGCAGGLAAAFTSWGVLKKPDLSMTLNGILAGLVGITAGADTTSAWGAVAVGAIAGVLVVFAVLFFDKIKIDDPVGAVSVHGICGNWGTIAVGIFGGGKFMTQLVGTLAVSAFAFFFSLVVFGIVKAVLGLRVSEEEEVEGLDVGEHGMPAYPYFQPVAER